MKSQKEKEIIEFLRDNIEPLPDKYDKNGVAYRASVYLTDGTYLPCVRFSHSKPIIELAMRRFQDEQKKDGVGGYYEIVKNFVAHGNCLNIYDIARVEKSRYALPVSVLEQIQGETTMAWTGFVVKMKDGKCFNFGTTYLVAFFDMPEGYSTDDIDEIINHSYVSQTGDVQSLRLGSFLPGDYNKKTIFRERPYFECFVDDL